MCIPQLMHRAGIAERDIYGRSGRDLSPANTWIVLPQLEMEKAFKNTVGWSPDCPLAPGVTQIWMSCPWASVEIKRAHGPCSHLRWELSSR
jgi:hypothetical protein